MAMRRAALLLFHIRSSEPQLPKRTGPKWINPLHGPRDSSDAARDAQAAAGMQWLPPTGVVHGVAGSRAHAAGDGVLGGGAASATSGNEAHQQPPVAGRTRAAGRPRRFNFRPPGAVLDRERHTGGASNPKQSAAAADPYLHRDPTAAETIDATGESVQSAFERPGRARADGAGATALSDDAARAEAKDRADRAIGDVRMAKQSVDPFSLADYSSTGVGSAQERRRRRMAMMEAALESGDAAELAIHGGGENEIDYGGMPREAYMAQPNRIALAEESALVQSFMNPKAGAMESRRDKRFNSWTTAAASAADASASEEVRARSTARQWHNSGGHYQDDFAPSTSLEHQREGVQHSVSIYTQRRLFLDGLDAYHGFVTAAEEKAICGELIALLSEPGTARYIPEESRYCVNLYEHRLGVPTQQAPLAFAMARAPTLCAALNRAFDLGLIAAPPNVLQVSEFVSNYSWYPPQRKHSSLGPYFGVLNLVSQAVLHMMHADQPWAPQLLALPRGLYVAQGPVLRDFRIGWVEPGHSTRTFQNSSRQARDYRIEVAFAHVDAERLPLLKAAVGMTERGRQRLLERPPGLLPPGTERCLAESDPEAPLMALVDADSRGVSDRGLRGLPPGAG